MITIKDESIEKFTVEDPVRWIRILIWRMKITGFIFGFAGALWESSLCVICSFEHIQFY